MSETNRRMSDLRGTFEGLVKKALENEDIQSYELKICGGNEKGEGYFGDITFVDVVARKMDDTTTTFSLVLKIGGRNKILRDIVKLGFDREIHVYANIIPAYWKLQDDYSLCHFTSMPKCYYTILSDCQEAMVLENLKSSGFKLHDRRAAMNLNHMELVLRVLGRWHALSFALSAKKPAEYERLIANWKCPITQMFVHSRVGEWINVAQKYLLKVLEESGELSLLKKYREKTRAQMATRIFDEILSSKEKQVVVAHGDCWNNNLMFKYQNDDETIPCDVSMLDFQLSNISSPALDLSYFVYAVASEKELNQFPELLKIYYSSLADYLHKMDCDAEEIFTYYDLKKHWNKYSAYGALTATMITCDNLVDTEDAANYGSENQNYLTVIESVDRKHPKPFRSRLIAVAKHFSYCEL